MQHRRIADRITPIICVSVAVACFFARAASGGGIDREADRLLGSIPTSNISFGLAVIDLRSEALILDRHSKDALIPASNQKLIAMAAALDILGADFEFRTRLGLRGSDLVIIGDGDPAIGDAKLCEKRGVSPASVFERWAEALLRRDHSSISGDLIIDASIFDTQVIHPTWEPADLQKWYAAPVGALNLADNCIEVTVWPTGRKGSPPQWSVEPQSTVLTIINHAVSDAKGTVLISRPTVSFEYILDGRCGSRQTLIPVPIPDPTLFFADACRAALARADVRIDGVIRRERVRLANGSIPHELEVIAEQRTPIGDVLSRIGTDSQNLFAECLAKRFGYEHMRRSSAALARGSWVTASSAMRAFIHRVGIDTAGLIVADASGLSRENRTTPAQLARLLASMHAGPNAAIFARSLAVAGRSGSLRKRMKDIPGTVVGKTGTLRGVRALSGYVSGKDGPRYAFSFIFNGIRGSSAPYKRLQDDLCRWLVSHAE